MFSLNSELDIVIIFSLSGLSLWYIEEIAPPLPEVEFELNIESVMLIFPPELIAPPPSSPEILFQKSNVQL